MTPRTAAAPRTHGETFAQYLDKKGWSLADFAQMSGVPRNTVKQWRRLNRKPKAFTCATLRVQFPDARLFR